MPKNEINIKTSINTDTIQEDYKLFTDSEAPLLRNTGIERDGGVTNIYESEVLFPSTGEYTVTDSGDLISLIPAGDFRTVYLNSTAVGQVSAYGVESRTDVTGFDDVFITPDDSYVTLKLVGGIITVSEYSLADVLLHTREILFPNLATVLAFYTSINFVRWNNIVYSDDLEFVLRLGEQVVILKEADPTVSITKALQSTDVLGTSNINCAVVYNNWVVFAGDDGRVGSFDGTNWKNYDGTGIGLGIFNSGDASLGVIGSHDILAATLYTYSGATYLVFAGAGGRLGCYNGSQFLNWDSTLPLTNNHTVVGTQDITSLVQYVDWLAVGSSGGRLGSWNGTSWDVYTDSSSTKLTDNSTLIGSNRINAMIVYDSLVVAGEGGRLGSYYYSPFTFDFTKTVYNAGSGFCNNATVVGSNDIMSLGVFNNTLLIGAKGGRIGNYTTSFHNYNSSADLTDNSTMLGTADVLVMSQVSILDVIYDANVSLLPDYVFTASATPDYIVTESSSLAIAGGLGRVASFNSDNSKVLYTASSGFRNAGTVIGNNSITGLSLYGSSVLVSGYTSVVNSMDIIGGFNLFYNDNGTVISNLLAGFNSFGYLYTYKYENGLYLINLTGNQLNRSYTLNDTTKDITIIAAAYCTPQVKNSKTRHIVSATDLSTQHIYTNSQITCLGTVGYTDFANYSGDIVYPYAPYVVSSVLQSVAGFNYADFTYKDNVSATNIYTYNPQYISSATALYIVNQSNTNTLINAYGKLTNGQGVAPVVPFEFRVGLIAGIQSFLSVALLDGNTLDTLGVLLTNVGEFDPSYTPMIVNDSTIMYKYNSRYIITKISKSSTNNIQKIAGSVYKLNSLSPQNILNTATKTISLGSIDYNGRMQLHSTATPSDTSKKLVSMIYDNYCNSIDTGDKLVTWTTPTSANWDIVGYRIPYLQNVNYGVDTYVDDIYSSTTLNDGSELALASKADLLYASTTILPVGLNYLYANFTLQTYDSTIFLNRFGILGTVSQYSEEYDGYTVGNFTQGLFTSFVLLGATYLFDGRSIYQANIQASIYQSKDLICSALGMTFITTTPNEAFFLSNYDNSLYTFNGGRSLTKSKRLNQLDTILQGAYNTRDNEILLEGTGHFYRIRDGIVTANEKKSTQTRVALYSTADGLVIANSVGIWKYTYKPQLTSTVVPLDLQTSYFAIDTVPLDKSILSAWNVIIYNEAKTKVQLVGTNYTLDTETEKEQKVIWDINPSDYSDGGYVRLRLKPQYQKVLGSSIRLQTNEKILIVSIAPEFALADTAVVAKSKSR